MQIEVMKPENHNGKLKELNELALTIGRQLQSSQTGYLHIHYHVQENEPQQTIPIYENFLFALALLRSRLMENMTEAKGIIEKLLAFQNYQQAESEGNFPIYLHDYPACYDRSQGIHILAPLYWIQKHFGHVLGQELKKRLEMSSRALIQYGLKTYQWKALPYAIAIRLGASLIAFGRLFSESDWEQKGQELSEALMGIEQQEHWYSTTILGDLLIALQMIQPDLTLAPWKAFWNYLCQTWNLSTKSYSGPSIKEFQKREEPQATFYDLFMGYLSGELSGRAKNKHFYQLQAAVIQPMTMPLMHYSLPSHLEGNYGMGRWELQQETGCAYTLLEKKPGLNPLLEKTYTPFKCNWGDGSRLHTLVCQGGTSSSISYEIKEGKVELFFDLAKDVDLENIEKQREIAFYLDYFPDYNITVEGQSTNTFHLGETLQIHTPLLIHRFVFELVEGEGQFLGHLMRGNRPSQIDLKGDQRFNAYDWMFFIRRIRRKGDCRLKVTWSKKLPQ